MHRTVRICIRKGSRLYEYCRQATMASARLYNRANYIVRQYVTAMDSLAEGKELYPNQLEVHELISALSDGTDYAPQSKWLKYKTLDYVLKASKDTAYYGVYSQANQQTLKLLMRDYRSYFGAVKKYKAHPEEFKGHPKLPGYCKQEKCKTTILTNQICTVKDGHYLKLPGTKTRINLGKELNGSLQEVRIVPMNGVFYLEIVVSCADQGIILPEDIKEYNASLQKEAAGYEDISGLRIVSIDPGTDNLCAMTNNFGMQPILIKGTILKSANRYYNKQLANMKSKAELCNKAKDTNRIRRLTHKRNCIITDGMHKISRYITGYCVTNNVDIIVLGHNAGQKQGINIGDANNQNFVQLPFLKLVHMLRYKLAQAGIRMIVTEESYTSKADFLAGDDIPVYKKDDDRQFVFSGRRIARGLYRHHDGTISNADINGAANIMRKVFPKVTQWDRGVVDTPCAVYVA